MVAATAVTVVTSSRAKDRSLGKDTVSEVCGKTGRSALDLKGCNFQPLPDSFFTARLEEAAEKVVDTAASSPQVLKREHIFNDLAPRLKSGPSQNLPEAVPFQNSSV